MEVGFWLKFAMSMFMSLLKELFLLYITKKSLSQKNCIVELYMSILKHNSFMELISSSLT